MFDFSWGELLIVGAVALVVLGPKELPNALRTVSNLTKSARRLAGEFQSGVNEIVREAELEDARKAAQSISKGSISKAIEQAVDPKGEMKASVSGLEKEVKSATQISPVGPIAPSPALAQTSTSNPSIAAPASDTPASEPEGTGAAPAKEEAKA